MDEKYRLFEIGPLTREAARDTVRRLGDAVGPELDVELVDDAGWFGEVWDPDSVRATMRAFAIALESGELDQDVAWIIEGLRDGMETWLKRDFDPSTET